jgi:poly-gamma-glutamate synthesis protein (capsule biosynthesis protein)
MSRRRPNRALAALAAAALAGASGVARSAAESGVPDGFVFAAGGDMIGPYHPAPGPEDAGFAAVSALFRSADLGFANQEGSIFDLATFQGFPAAENGGGYPVQTPPAAGAIRAMGITVVSKANNHATDWGTEGLVATLRSLAAAGVAQAGSGLDPVQARAPGYVATPKGVAALVDTASTFPPMSVAGPAVTRQGVTSAPRPGISPLHVREVALVTAAELAALRGMAGASADAEGVRIGDVVFRAAARAGAAWEMDAGDEAAILAQVAQARRHARFVLFSIHAHETAGHDDAPAAAPFQPMALHRADEAPSPDDPAPAPFEPVLFHAAIDAGADAVVRTGPHSLGGIEIYKGRPIFYSLGSLFYDFGGRRAFTSPGGETLAFPDAWFETIVPVSVYRDGKVAEIKLYPLTIESGPGPLSGVPHPADPVAARRILERIKALSAAFGTVVEIEGGVGVIRASGD